MYHAIVARMTRRAFSAVNAKDYEVLLRLCRPDVHHRFGGDHALGGQRHDVATLRLWFERLGRVLPALHLDVTDVWVTGRPGRTVVVARWEATATLLDGEPYRNRGLHAIAMSWGRITSIDAHEDSLAVSRGLRRQADAGLAEAVAAPLES